MQKKATKTIITTAATNTTTAKEHLSQAIAPKLATVATQAANMVEEVDKVGIGAATYLAVMIKTPAKRNDLRWIQIMPHIGITK